MLPTRPALSGPACGRAPLEGAFRCHIERLFESRRGALTPATMLVTSRSTGAPGGTSGRRGPRSAKCRNAEDQLTVVDLFAGAGGLSEGFRQAGFSIVAASDNDPDAAATFAKNFPEARFIVGDIRAKAIKEQILDTARNASVLVGGPPCQAFSQVRNHTRVID